MPTKDWNLILNAVILAMITIGGVWIVHVKNGTIESLRTEIEQLKGQVAPSIIAEHRTMQEYAVQMTKEKQELERALKNAIDEKTAVSSALFMWNRGRYFGLAESVHEINVTLGEVISKAKAGDFPWDRGKTIMARSILATETKLIERAKATIDSKRIGEQVKRAQQMIDKLKTQRK